MATVVAGTVVAAGETVAIEIVAVGTVTMLLGRRAVATEDMGGGGGCVVSTAVPNDWLPARVVTGAKRVPKVAWEAGITVMGLPINMVVVVTGVSVPPADTVHPIILFGVRPVWDVARDTTPPGPPMEMGVSCTQLSTPVQPCALDTGTMPGRPETVTMMGFCTAGFSCPSVLMSRVSVMVVICGGTWLDRGSALCTRSALAKARLMRAVPLGPARGPTRGPWVTPGRGASPWWG
uniref:Uncharacterized protein n=1 Tax=Ixodes ricinus TaxID=34613 RepID=A0A6B0V4F1_IXORI